MVANLHCIQRNRNAGRSLPVRGTLFTTAFLMPWVANAHPGHGVEDGAGLLHEVMSLAASSPVVGCLIVAGLVAAALLVRRTRWDFARER